MKTCAHCKTENRDEAIFCQRCRRPLQATRTTSPHLLFWLLLLLVLVGLIFFLFVSRPSPAQTPAPTSNSSNDVPVPTRTQEPLTPGACVRDNTIRIRRGPGTQYETIGGLVPGICLKILGRNEETSWVYIVSDDSQTGWVDASLLSEAGDLSRVSLRDHSGMASPARPTLTTEELAHGAQVYLTSVSATNIPHSSLTRYMVPCFVTADRIGDHIACRLERAYCDYLSTVEGSPTVCNDRPAPDQVFALVVFGEDWSDYDGQCLIVSGYLEIARGMLQVQALNRSQVSVCD